MTARLVGFGLVAAAAMVLMIPGISLAASTGVACTCTQPKPARKAVKKVRQTAHKQIAHRRATRRQAHAQAYAERFYNYWKASPVSMRNWHGEWRGAPHDWRAPSAYEGAAYEGPAYGGGYAWNSYYEDGYYGSPAYESAPGISIDRYGWSGGVGGVAAAGGGGGYGAAVIARDGGLNGPTYNDYNQSFQYNPSHAGPWVPRPSRGGRR